MKVVKLADWFVSKNFPQSKAQAIKNGATFEVVKETEKAVFLKIITDFGVFTSWSPKSVCNK